MVEEDHTPAWEGEEAEVLRPCYPGQRNPSAHPILMTETKSTFINYYYV